jgi:hypothetical protein
MIDAIFEATFKKKYENRYDDEIQQSINAVVLQNLLELCSNSNATFQVKSITLAKVKELKYWFFQNNNKKDMKSSQNSMYEQGYIKLIDTFLTNPEQFKREDSPKIPDGSPIGTFGCDLGHL